MSTTHRIKLADVMIEQIEEAIKVLGIRVHRVNAWCDDIASWGLGDVDISLCASVVEVHYALGDEKHEVQGYNTYKKLSRYLHDKRLESD